jgi:hypothetical protein
MADVFAELALITGEDGRVFMPRVCGAPFEHRWEGWLEFTATDDGEIVRTPRETTQPKRSDLEYWAGGLTPTYVAGALSRALTARAPAARDTTPVAAYTEPAPRDPLVPLRPDGVLDPFTSLQRNGEWVLRQQLEALAGHHLVNIIRANGLSAAPAAELELTPPAVLVDLIVSAARARAARPL